MATSTSYLSLSKPDYTDAADIAVINTNMDTIDSNVHGNAVDIAGIATIITGTTNNSGHSVSSGEYFIANGAKYKATAAIGTGVTWADKSSSVSDHDLINALNGKIKKKTITATTTASGNVSLDLSPSCFVLSAMRDGVVAIVIPYKASTTWWAHVTQDDANLTAYPNLSVTITVVYIESVG